jgi:guanine deaminase
MQQAIEVAKHGETPYGCVIVHRRTGTSIVAANSTQQNGKTAHAEMEALRQLPKSGWPVEDLTLITTGEPCPMCMGAIMWCGITHVIYGLSIDRITHYHKQIALSSRVLADCGWVDTSIVGGVLEASCAELFEAFV